MFKPNTKVRFARKINGTTDWTETAKTYKPRKTYGENVPGPDWNLVRFEDGGTLCVHDSNLKAA